MIALLAKLDVAAGKEEEFEAAMLALVADVRANEPGNQLYTLVKGDDGYAVMELYDDDAALAAHTASDHFKAAMPKLGAVLAGRGDIKRYEVIG